MSIVHGTFGVLSMFATEADAATRARIDQTGAMLRDSIPHAGVEPTRRVVARVARATATVALDTIARATGKHEDPEAALAEVGEALVVLAAAADGLAEVGE